MYNAHTNGILFMMHCHTKRSGAGLFVAPALWSIGCGLIYQTASARMRTSYKTAEKGWRS